jgi:hypothetical protein
MIKSLLTLITSLVLLNLSEAKQTASGVFELSTTDAPNIGSDEAWQNPNVAGVVARTLWSSVEPTDVKKGGAYNWNFLDAAVKAAQSNNKKLIISVESGIHSPSWLYSAGAKKFSGIMPQPWDPVFRDRWGQFIKALAARYDGVAQLVAVTMSGPGQKLEYVFADTQARVNELNQAGGPSVWQAAANAVTDDFASAFVTTPFFLATSNAILGDGRASLTNVVSYGLSKYPNRFGIQCNELQSGSHTTGPFPHININMPLSPCILQMLQSENSGRLGTGTNPLNVSLNNGIMMGAWAIEVYSADCEDPEDQPDIAAANATLLAKHP